MGHTIRMKLTDEQCQKIDSLIAKLPCACGATTWNIEPQIYMHRGWEGFAATQCPVVLMICMACANALSFSAVVLGIVSKDNRLLI